MKTTLITLSALLSLATAHFELSSPKVRGFNEDLLTDFPCGGQNTVSSERSEFPLTDGQVTVVLGHSTTNLEILIALGNNPGSAFNTIIKAPFFATGLGNLCISDLDLSGLNITAGTNATIQVQTGGDPDGGLYNCADITFVDSLANVQGCPTSDIAISAATVSGHPNGTAFTGAEESAVSSMSSATQTQTQSGSATAATTTPTSTPGAGNVVNAGLGGLVLAGAAAFALVL